MSKLPLVSHCINLNLISLFHYCHGSDFQENFKTTDFSNLLVTSKNEFSNFPIQELKLLQNVFKIKEIGLKCFKK